MTISAEPIASGGHDPGIAVSITVIPTVSTRKNVPMNSTTYFAMDRNSRIGTSRLADVVRDELEGGSHRVEPYHGQIQNVSLRGNSGSRSTDAAICTFNTKNLYSMRLHAPSENWYCCGGENAVFSRSVRTRGSL